MSEWQASMGLAQTSSMPMLGDDQYGVVGRDQLLAAGVSPSKLRTRVDRGQWQRVHRGVYATFSGRLPRMATLWAAVLAAGTGATLSHATAAELAGLADQADTVVHVSIPGHRRVSGLDGVVIHVSS